MPIQGKADTTLESYRQSAEYFKSEQGKVLRALRKHYKKCKEPLSAPEITKIIKQTLLSKNNPHPTSARVSDLSRTGAIVRVGKTIGSAGRSNQTWRPATENERLFHLKIIGDGKRFSSVSPRLCRHLLRIKQNTKLRASLGKKFERDLEYWEQDIRFQYIKKFTHEKVMKNARALRKRIGPKKKDCNAIIKDKVTERGYLYQVGKL